MTAQGHKGRVPEPAEVWGLARAETKAPVAADKANGPDGAAATVRGVVVAKGKAADAEETGKARISGHSEKGAAACQVETERALPDWAQ